MAKKLRTPKEHTTDPAAQQMLIRADELALGTALHLSWFYSDASRVNSLAPRPGAL